MAQGERTSRVEDAQLVAGILSEVRYGVPPSVAAQARGVPERTWFNWLALGRDPRKRGRMAEACRRLVEQVDQAKAYATSHVQLTHQRVALGQAVRREVRRVVVNDDGVREDLVEREFWPPDARALQWWLERRRPEFYGAVVARDADSQDPDEVMPPAAADLDPAAAANDLARLLDRYAAAPPAGPSPAGGVPAAGGD